MPWRTSTRNILISSQARSKCGAAFRFPICFVSVLSWTELESVPCTITENAYMHTHMAHMLYRVRKTGLTDPHMFAEMLEPELIQKAVAKTDRTWYRLTMDGMVEVIYEVSRPPISLCSSFRLKFPVIFPHESNVTLLHVFVGRQTSSWIWPMPNASSWKVRGRSKRCSH